MASSRWLLKIPNRLDEAVSYLNACDQKQKFERVYEFKSRDTMLSFVTGRLKRALHEWKLIYVAQFINEDIEFGYFHSHSGFKRFEDNRSALTEKLNGPPEI